jgi:hypothetical protein
MASENSLSKKLLWFVGLWFLGVLAVTIVGLAIKLSLGA